MAASAASFKETAWCDRRSRRSGAAPPSRHIQSCLATPLLSALPLCRLQESHKAALNCVAFNFFSKGLEDVFASAGSNRVRCRGAGWRQAAAQQSPAHA